MSTTLLPRASNMTFEEWIGKDNEIGLSIMMRKYVRGNETFAEWLHRVSGGDEELAKLILEKKLLLGGRTMANRGTDTHASYFNCYSRGFVEDDYRDIMQAAVDIGMTFKAQGGQGISLSKLRPKGAPIGKDYSSDGIIPFMKIYNEVTAGTSQGGARKGALLLSLDAMHKEAETFIRIKSQEGLIEKANLSLEIDDRFMEAVDRYYETGEVITLHERRNYSGHIVEYDVVPIEVFKALIDNCYDWADPAALFTKRLRNYNLMQYDDDYVIETVNPCGEQPLPRSGACCLASINLSEFVRKPYSEKAYFDTSELVEAVKVGVRSLDRLIDENEHRHPLPEQREMSHNYRNIGLGCFGYATALMKLGLVYGSEEALEFTDSIFALMFRAAVIESNRLASELGPYPRYKDCVWDSDIMRIHFPQDEIDRMRSTGLRNCSLISIAPTGSIATMLGESGGCEPEFAMKYTRRTVGMTEGEDTYYDVYCKAAREYMATHDTAELPRCFISAPEVPWRDRIMTQAVMQRHVDTGISSTVNLPNGTTREEIAQLYLLAWKQGLKGVTIFRDGCLRMPILSSGQPAKLNQQKASEQNQTPDRGVIIEVSDALVGKKRKLTTGCGSLHCSAFFDPKTGNLMETFLYRGSAGGCANSYTGLSRMISLAARAGVRLQDIVDQLNSCGVCPSYAVRRATRHDTSQGSCCPIAIGKALTEMWEEYQRERGDPPASGMSASLVSPTEAPPSPLTERCPECGATLVFEGGCQICKECGWSKCN